jgi:hypothetical protein
LDHFGHLAPFFNPLFYCFSLVTSFSFSLNESNFLNSQLVEAFKNDNVDVVYANFDDDDDDVVYANFVNNDEHKHKTRW